jgi:hypothetical protein
MASATKDGRLQLLLTHKILYNIVKTKWTFHRMQKKAQGALFVEPSIYSMDYPATAQTVYSVASGNFMRPGEISVRNTSKGIRTEPLRLRNHQWLCDGVNPVGHPAAGKKILAGQSINLPTAKFSSLGHTEMKTMAAREILSACQRLLALTLKRDKDPSSVSDTQITEAQQSVSFWAHFLKTDASPARKAPLSETTSDAGSSTSKDDATVSAGGARSRSRVPPLPKSIQPTWDPSSGTP